MTTIRGGRELTCVPAARLGWRVWLSLGYPSVLCVDDSLTSPCITGGRKVHKGWHGQNRLGGGRHNSPLVTLSHVGQPSKSQWHAMLRSDNWLRQPSQSLVWALHAKAKVESMFPEMHQNQAFAVQEDPDGPSFSRRKWLPPSKGQGGNEPCSCPQCIVHRG